MLRRWLIGALALLSVVALAGEVGTEPQHVHAATDLAFTQNCNTPGEQFFDVPAGVTQMIVSLAAPRGGESDGAGGAGATGTAKFNVTAGQRYYLDLGCPGSGPNGGWNGGGAAGAGSDRGAGGGGASILRASACGILPTPCPLFSLLAVGGGGGGAGAGDSSGGAGGGHNATVTGLTGGDGGGGGIPPILNGKGGTGGSDVAFGVGGASGGGGSTAGVNGDDTGRDGQGGAGGVEGNGGSGGGGGGGCHGGGGGGGANSGGAGGGGGGGGGNCSGAGATNVSYGVNGVLESSALVQFISPPVLTKAFVPSSIISGAISTLTFTLDNDNPRPISNVSFIDNIGLVSIQVAPTPNFTQDCGVGTFSGFTAGSTVLQVTGVGLSDDGFLGESCTITVDVTSTVIGAHVNNTSTVTSNETSPGPIATATLTVTAPPTVDLVATKTSSASPQVGVPFTWTVQVRNQGNASAFFPNPASVFTDNLPNTNISYAPTVSVTNQSGITGALACSIAGSDVTCMGNGLPFSIAAGGGFDLTITATASAGGNYDNPRNGGSCQVDPAGQVAENNSGGTAETNNGCSNRVTIVDTTDLTIAITPGASSWLQGQTGATYTIGVGNGVVPTATATARAAAADPRKVTVGAVTVVVTLPTGLTATAIAGTGWTCDLPTLTCTRSDGLNDGATYPPILLTVNVANNAPATVTVTAVVSNVNEPIANRGNNTASATTPVGALAADLAVTKAVNPITATAGANLTYTVTLRNNGPGSATTVVLSDPIPANTTFVSAVSSDPGFTVVPPAVGSGPPAVVTFTAPSLANGGTVTFTIVVRVNTNAPAGNIVNTATVTATTLDPVATNNAATATAPAAPQATPTMTPTAIPTPFIPPVIPQVFQNPGVQGIFAPGNRATPTPQRAVAPAAVLPSSNVAPIVLRPPSTGDAGMWRLPKVW